MKYSVFQKWWTEYKIEVCYAICIMLVGTLLHFIYEWSDRNAFVALFAPVNESVWEHLKLFFVPAFFFTIFVHSFIKNPYPNALWCQTKSILAGILFIIVAYFLYSGITKQEWMWMDIGIFYLSAILAGIVSGRCRKQICNKTVSYEKYACTILLALWTLFIWFTYSVPDRFVKWLPGLFISEA